MMKVNINKSEYNFINNIRDNKEIRDSFNKLAEKTFGLNFEPWYQNGYWGHDYIPYVLLKDDKVVANVSVNIIKTRWEEETKLYIQLGTVMTDKEYRNKGLSKYLINKVLEDWKDKSHAIYLFANNSVLDFYPKFGFEKAHEYQYYKEAKKKEGLVKKLDMSVEDDKKLLIDYYKKSNPFSALPMENNEGLLMFYCSQFLKENIYYIADYDSVIIAEYDNDNLVWYDIFTNHDCTLDDILSIISKENIKKAILGFTPKEIKDFNVEELKGGDTTLFILKEKENLFEDNKLMFPLLSHA